MAFRLPPPSRSARRGLRSSDAQHDERGLRARVGDVVDQLEEGRLRPLEVVQHDDERTGPAETSNSPEQPGRSSRSSPLRLAEPDASATPSTMIAVRLALELRRDGAFEGALRPVRAVRSLTTSASGQ